MVRDAPNSTGKSQGGTTEAPGLLVLHQRPADKAALWRRLQGENWVVLSFEDEGREEEFLASCQRRGINVLEVHRAADYIDKASLVAREKYLQFIAQWPNTFRKNGKNFKQSFTYKGEISYWWLSTASFKDNEVSPTFQYLCHLEVVRQALVKSGFPRCTLLTRDGQMAHLVARCCAHMQLPFAVEGDLRGQRDLALLRGLASQTISMVYLVLNLLFSRFALSRPNSDGEAGGVAFLTIYPDCLEFKEDGPEEENYRDLPEKVAARSGVTSTLLAAHPHASASDFYKLWTRRKFISEARNPRVLFLGNFLHPSDLGVALWNLLFFFRYFWMDWTDRRFRESFVYDGINVYELVGREFRRWFLGSQIPSYLVVARAVERAVRSERVRLLVCFLELYPLARAVYYGAKRGNPNINTIAYQHASINRMKLWYNYRPEELVPSGASRDHFIDTMPIPDQYIFQGRNGLRIIQESGYPAQRCILTGSARYDGLSEPAPEPDPAESFFPDNAQGARKTRVLVLPSLSQQDADELIDTTARACNGSSEYAVLVKPHPDCPVDPYVESAREVYEDLDIKVVHGGLRALVKEADVVVTSYSTAGDEAIALGRPVVCYTGLRPCGATFPDIEAAPLVHSAAELRRSLQSMLHDEEYLRKYQAKWPELVEGTFYLLDGRAGERIIEALLASQSGSSH